MVHFFLILCNMKLLNNQYKNVTTFKLALVEHSFILCNRLIVRVAGTRSLSWGPWARGRETPWAGRQPTTGIAGANLTWMHRSVAWSLHILTAKPPHNSSDTLGENVHRTNILALEQFCLPLGAIAVILDIFFHTENHVGPRAPNTGLTLRTSKIRLYSTSQMYSVSQDMFGGRSSGCVYLK